jgi:beta-lactamase regulating signal transducer with metallopeptidase domain
MTSWGPRFAEWWLHAALGGGFILLLAGGLALACRQPAWKQRLSEWGVLAALVVALLSLGPAWLAIPVLSPEPARPSSPSGVNVPKSASKAPSSEEMEEPSESESPPVTWFPGDPRPDLESWFLFQDDSATLEHFPAARTEQTDSPSERANRNKKTLRPDGVSAEHAGVATTFAFDGGALLTGLGCLYLTIAALFAARWLIGHAALWRLLRTARPSPEPIYDLLQEVCNGEYPPRLLVSDRVPAPISCGLFRPTIVLPELLVDSPEQTHVLPWVLKHEWTHLKRCDGWTWLLFGLAQAVYFYLPWLWWLKRSVRLCQEYVADAAAVEEAPEPADYAQYLLGISQKTVIPVAATGVSGKPSDLFRRMTMLLKNPYRVETRCPRWLSPVAGLGLLSAAVLISGVGVRANATTANQDEPKAKSEQQDKQQPPPNPEKTDKPKKERKKAVRSVPRDEDSPEVPSPFRDQGEGDRQREQFNRMREQFRNFQQQGENQFRFGGPGNQALFYGLVSEGRLGVRAAKPNPALADQLNLPEDEGLVIEEVRSESPADKAGLKAHDVLLEFNGHKVSSDVQKLRHLIDEAKADVAIDAVVLRKGKKETISSIKLPEAKHAANPFFRPGGGFNPPSGLQPPNFAFNTPQGRAFAFTGSGGHNVMTTIFRDNDRFTTRHQEGSLVITITGTVHEGSTKVSQIEVQDGAKDHKYESLDKVPEQYRDKVKNLLDMNEKGTSKIEIHTPSNKKKSGDKPKGPDSEEGQLNFSNPRSPSFVAVVL